MSAAADPARLPEDARARVAAVVDLLAADPSAPSAVRDPDEAWRVHIGDSLTGLAVEDLRKATTIADIGSGAGFPGLVLAATLQRSRVDLIEAVERKCAFMRRAVEAGRIVNARVVCARAEEWARSGAPDGGREAYAAATARAVGRLATLAELASPLLSTGGRLIAWKGRRDPDEEAELGRAAERVAMELVEVMAIAPTPAAKHRHLHVLRKTGATPEGLPRRAGMAKKRPFGRA